ncbi:MAG: hypothetical protein EOP52_03115 [Sphingobacteriales bacterium]|nr:MAG: hypothetical protein EOP52_03115 [Sphingobacteriales bacterium]
MERPYQAYHAINWADGMKISRTHFVGQENHLLFRITESVAAQLHSFDYGLLPAPAINQFANEIRFEILSGNEVEIVISRLDALTPSGYRITSGMDELASQLRFTVSAPALSATDGFRSDEDAYLALLQVRPFERIPAGPLDPEEIPYRHPYALPAMQVALLPESQYNPAFPGNHFVVLGRLVRRAGALTADDQFIPPCTSIRSHPLLMRQYENIGVYISEMQQNAWSIVQKTRSRAQQTDLSRSIRGFCEDLVTAISQIYFRFRNLSFHLPPIYCVEAIATLAGQLMNSLQLLPEREKEEEIKYFAEWCDVQPGQLESHLSQVIELRYEHLRVARHFQQIDALLQMVSTILQRLNRLEYIGLHKENIVVKEEVVSQTIKPKKGWSLLD